MTIVLATPAADAAPLEGFSQCHTGILYGLEALDQLPALTVAAQRAAKVAQATVALFEQAVTSHHADEEAELFPAVLRSALPGAEHRHVEILVERLVAEHRMVEELWRHIRPAVRKAAAGQPADLDPEDVKVLVRAYVNHAAFEELEFLPLARDILGRNGNHMAALGLSLHMRHVPMPSGFI